MLRILRGESPRSACSRADSISGARKGNDVRSAPM